jgi:hypothetical protein
VVDIYDETNQFPLFPRAKAETAYTLMTSESEGGFWQQRTQYRKVVGNRSGYYFKGYLYLSLDQHTIFSKYINHCYTQSMVNTIWNIRLSGYPIRVSEAKNVIEYAQARTDTDKTECLTTAAQLSFLK